MPAVPKPSEDLTRRERQVMDILHRRGAQTVAEIMAELPEPPTYSAVRSILRILGEKRLISFREDGPRYVYFPSAPTEQAQAEVLDHVVRTYFAGSTEHAVTALLRLADTELSEHELQALRARIAGARLDGR